MAKKGAGGEPVAAAVEELPRSIVRRIVKDKLEQLASTSSSKTKGKGAEGGEGNENDMIVNKEALLAFSESARIFIHYLSATANDICREAKRQTINAEDIFQALEEIEFPEFIGPLRASLEDYRQKNAAKKKPATKENEANKKRKMEEETQDVEAALEDETDTKEAAADDADDNGEDGRK